MMKLFSRLLIAVFLLLIAVCAAQERSQDDQPHIVPRKPIKQKQEAQPQGESSSRDSLIVPGGGSGAASSTPGVQELLPYDPHRAAKDVEVGQYYLKRRNYRAALDRFNDALLYKPRDAEATYGLAQTQEKMGLLDQSYKNYEAYIEIFPGGPYVKDSQEAMRRLSALLAAESAGNQNPEARQKIEEGEALLANNDFEEAHSSFARAVELQPDDPLANLRLAQSLMGLQRLDEARMYFQKCLDAHPPERYADDAKRGIARVNAVLGK